MAYLRSSPRLKMNNYSFSIHQRFMSAEYGLGMKFHILIFAFATLIAPAYSQTSTKLVVNEAESHVSVAVHATMDSFVGKLDKYALVVEADPSGRITSAKLNFAFADLHTGKADRDKEMLKWIAAAQFPDGEFTLVELLGTQADHYTAKGKLKLHGIEHDVQFPVAILHQGSTYSIDGEAPVDYREYGLPIIRKFGMLRVDPTVKIQFHVQGEAAK